LEGIILPVIDLDVNTPHAIAWEVIPTLITLGILIGLKVLGDMTARSLLIIPIGCLVVPLLRH
jgi:hypothetical protein